MKKPLIIAMLFALAACGGTEVVKERDDLPDPDNEKPTEPVQEPDESEPELNETPWVLKFKASEKGIRTAPPNTAYYSIEFHSDGTVTGDMDCNKFSGTYTASTNSIAFADIAEDTAACTEEHSLSTQAVRDSLNMANTYTIHESELTIISQDGQKMVFEPMHSGCEEPLTVAEGNDSNVYFINITDEASESDIVTELEASRPDFVLTDQGMCSSMFSASMNANTLSILRCRPDIEHLSVSF